MIVVNDPLRAIRRGLCSSEVDGRGKEQVCGPSLCVVWRWQQVASGAVEKFPLLSGSKPIFDTIRDGYFQVIRVVVNGGEHPLSRLRDIRSGHESLDIVRGETGIEPTGRSRTAVKPVNPWTKEVRR